MCLGSRQQNVNTWLKCCHFQKDSTLGLSQPFSVDSKAVPSLGPSPHWVRYFLSTNIWYWTCHWYLAGLTCCRGRTCFLLAKKMSWEMRGDLSFMPVVLCFSLFDTTLNSVWVLSLLIYLVRPVECTELFCCLSFSTRNSIFPPKKILLNTYNNTSILSQINQNRVTLQLGLIIA